MPEYLAPGVYIEEIETGPRPIEGVSTSTAGFVGETERGSDAADAGHQLGGLPARFGGYIDRPPIERARTVTCPTRCAGSSTTAGSGSIVARVIGAGAASGRRRACRRRRDPRRSWRTGPVTGATASGRAAASAGARSSRPPAGRPAGAQWFRIRVLYYRDDSRSRSSIPRIRRSWRTPIARRARRLRGLRQPVAGDPTRSNFAQTVVNNGVAADSRSATARPRRSPRAPSPPGAAARRTAPTRRRP